jgi:DNA-binding LacI/PurR family transcriptional regulator
MSSLKVIASKAGVSMATVSRALNNESTVNEETRARILDVANAVGYRRAPARHAETTMVALTYACEMLATPFDQALLAGINRAFIGKKFNVTFLSALREKQEDETFAQFYLRHGVQGAIIRTSSQHKDLAAELALHGVPSVVVGEQFDDARISAIYTDARDEMRRAVEHLIHIGHRRIAFVMMAAPNRAHRQRYGAYREALETHGIPLDPELVFEITPKVEGGSNAVTRALALPDPPTAVVATNPPLSLGVLRRCQELGIRVPEEISIIGFDDADLRTWVHPRLSAVCQDAELLGYDAARWIMKRLTSEDVPPLRTSLKACLELNQTTAAPPAQPVRVLPDGRRQGVAAAAAPAPAAGAPGARAPLETA